MNTGLSRAAPYSYTVDAVAAAGVKLRVVDVSLWVGSAAASRAYIGATQVWP